MDNWTQVNGNLIQHESGFRIFLTAGTWRSPQHIEPLNANNESALYAAKLLGEGLVFARDMSRNSLLRQKIGRNKAHQVSLALHTTAAEG
jgi:hypothetical protein